MILQSREIKDIYLKYLQTTRMDKEELIKTSLAKGPVNLVRLRTLVKGKVYELHGHRVYLGVETFKRIDYVSIEVEKLYPSSGSVLMEQYEKSWWCVPLGNKL